MKLAIQHHLLPGKDLSEKFAKAAEYGFQGVELTGWGFDGPMSDHLATIEQAKGASGLPISSLCSHRPDDFVHPERSERETRLAGLVALIRLADRLEAPGVIGLPIRNPLHMPDLAPVADEQAVTTQLTVAGLKAALAATPDARAAIFLEPLNRYETWYMRTVGQAAALCAAAASDRVQVMADVYHMNIEEVRIDDALREHAQQIGHVHLADSNRWLPGEGHTDFVAVFRALKQIGFGGWMALECAVGDQPEESLPRAVRWLRERWEEA